MPELSKILHIEDEPDIQAVARMTLEALGGFKVESCGSGQEALKIAPLFLPDMILLDVMMPGMDGPTTLLELRKLQGFADTPVIFMTAKAQDSEIDQFKVLGAVDVITKPFDPMTLSDQIREIWNSIQKV